MPFEPGYVTGAKNDCMRCAVAATLGVHQSRVRFVVSPTPEARDVFWPKWESYLASRFGVHLRWLDSEERQEFRKAGKRWIAIVHGFDEGRAHAIAMEGKRLVHDPAKPKRRRGPWRRHVTHGIALEPGE